MPADSIAKIGKKKAGLLLDHPGLWRARDLLRAEELKRTQKSGTDSRAVPSGFATLDAHLPGGGWPRAGLSEFLLSTAGIGELQLLLPALRHLSAQGRWIAWVNPPFIPYAPTLSAAGVDIRKILLIHPKDHKQALWAAEQACRSGACSTVLAWLNEKRLSVKDTRRLQLAAKQGRTFSCLFRPERALNDSSMAELRMQITAADSASVIEAAIHKRRGGWPVSGLRIQLADGASAGPIREQLSAWRQWRARRPDAQLPMLERSVPGGSILDPVLENSILENADMGAVANASDPGRRVTH